jgi:hypothetical protein
VKDIPTAFPWTHDDLTCTGMTLRDYFAAKAIQGLLASEVNAPLDVFAKQAYKVADKMMEARNGSQ